MRSTTGTIGSATNPDQDAKIVSRESTHQRRWLAGWEDCAITVEPRAWSEQRMAAPAGWTGRPALFAIAIMNAITGWGALIVLIPLTFGSDIEIFRRGAALVPQGLIAPDFFYTPLFGALALPLTLVPPATAAILMTVLTVAVLLAGVAFETRGLSPFDRLLVAIAAIGFLPVVYELLAGQVTLFLVAAIYPARRADGWSRGIALGLALGLIPKPILVPVLVWMLIYRRRALLAALLVAVLVTAVGVAVLGTHLYVEWIDAVAGAGRITRPGNMALTSIDAPVIQTSLWIGAAAISLWVMLRDETIGFVAAVLAALLLTPYTQAYAVSIILLAVKPAYRAAPRATALLALVANPAVLVAFIPWTFAALGALAAAARRSPARPGARP